MKKFSVGMICGFILAACLVWIADHRQVYVGPVMHTADGDEYFCTFETKRTFEDYMREQHE